MSQQSQNNQPAFLAQVDQPLIGIPLEQEDGCSMVAYFTEESAVDVGLTPLEPTDALGLAGSWGDLDWDEMERALDRIRHQVKPSPPLGT